MLLTYVKLQGLCFLKTQLFDKIITRSILKKIIERELVLAIVYLRLKLQGLHF